MKPKALPLFLSVLFTAASAFFTYAQEAYDDTVTDYSQAVEDRLPMRLDEPWDAAYTFSGGYHEAIAGYTRTLPISPSSTVAYLARGLTHYLQGEFDAALDDLSEVIRRGDAAKMAAVHSFRGRAYIRLEHY